MASSSNTTVLDEPIPWQNNSSSILGIVVTALALSGACVIGRLYTRWRVVVSLGWDDLLVCLCLLTAIASCISVCLAPSYGLGQHLSLVSPDDVQTFLLLFYVANAAYISSTTFIKLSLLFQYLRIYEKGSSIRTSCVFLIIIISLWGAAFSFMAWVPCLPVAAYWNLDPSGQCYGFGILLDRTTFVAHTALNMVFDMLVFAVPVHLYFEKDSSTRTRMGMLALLILGCLVNVLAAWRLALLIGSRNDPDEILDLTWYAPATLLLSVAEVTLASICASIPIFWPALSYSLGAIFVTKEVEVTHGDRDENGSRPESETEMAPQLPGIVHYRDSFVLDQVDPLRKHLSAGVETVVTSDNTPDRWKKYFEA